jgi:hypothetical protein
MDPAWILIIGWFGIGAVTGLLVLAVGWVKNPPRKGQWIRPADPRRPMIWMPPVSAAPIVTRAVLATALGLCFVPVVLLFGFAGTAKSSAGPRPARRW